MSDQVGFAVVPNWLVRDTTVDRNIKFLFLLLSSRAGRDGVSWPSQERLADEMGVSTRQVKRYLSKMRDMGLVQVYSETTRTGRRNRYRLTVDAMGGDERRVPTPPAMEGGEGTPMSPRVGTPMSLEEEPLEEEPEQLVRGSSGADTEAPKRVPRPDYVATAAPQPMPSGWYPSDSTIAYLRYRASGSAVTVENSYDRFVAFHREAGKRQRSWDEAFIAWVSDDLVRARRDSKVEESTHDDLGQRRGVDPEVRARTLEAMRLRTEQQARLVTKDEEQ